MTLTELWHQSFGLLPELIIALTICLVIFFDMFSALNRSKIVCGFTSLIGCSLALLVLMTRLTGGMESFRTLDFSQMIAQDQISHFFRIIFFLGTSICILFSIQSRETDAYRQGEYFSLLLGAMLGADFLVMSNNIIMFILGLETLSMCSYVLAAFIKHQRISSEAGLKYMLYGSVASGVLFFGFSYLYGITGTATLNSGMTLLFSQAASGAISRLAVMLVLVLILAGIGFKMAMVPFHFWCPDVYQGSPTPITAFLSIVSKAAGFGGLLRLLLPLYQNVSPSVLVTHDLPILFGILAIITMTFGNLVAIRQNDVKRLLAYSSIAHAGYLMLGLMVYNQASLEAIFFYFFVYLFMNLGAFWVVIVIVNQYGSAHIEKFRSAMMKSPLLFTAMFIFLISLTGIPPTAGFVGKFMLFKLAIGEGVMRMAPTGHVSGMSAFFIAVAVIGILNSAVSLYYYMRIAKIMAFENDSRPLTLNAVDRSYALAFAIPTVALLFFSPILQLIQMTAQ
jgi:NADH-quinone oxidoreductase subunit N